MTAATTPGGAPGARAGLRRVVEVVLSAILVAAFARAYVLQGFRVPSPSMVPTLVVGDHVLVNKFIFGPRWLELERRFLPLRPVARGDLVVFKLPGAATQDYVKRCVGLPGDVVAIRGGRLWINGAEVREALGGSVELVPDFGPLVVPVRQYFMLGDHRGASSDSRSWGTVPESYLRGRPMLVYWSLEVSDSGGWPWIQWHRLLSLVR